MSRLFCLLLCRCYNKLMKKQFPGQRDDEQVVFVFRRHPIVITKGIIAFIIITVLGFVPFIIVPSNQHLLFVAAIAAFIGLLVLFYHWIGWYFSVYIVTNQRIRQSRQKGFFNKSVVDLGLNKIQSAYVEVQGLLGSLLKYGTIILHTQVGDMHIKKVASAETVYGKIQEEIGKVEYENQPETDE